MIRRKKSTLTSESGSAAMSPPPFPMPPVSFTEVIMHLAKYWEHTVSNYAYFSSQKKCEIGSVGAKNASDLQKEQDIDGFLVGGASLTTDFLTITASRA
jgi:hypothetical protein